MAKSQNCQNFKNGENDKSDKNNKEIRKMGGNLRKDTYTNVLQLIFMYSKKKVKIKSILAFFGFEQELIELHFKNKPLKSDSMEMLLSSGRTKNVKCKNGTESRHRISENYAFSLLNFKVLLLSYYCSVWSLFIF
jgi:hypothetical protein